MGLVKNLLAGFIGSVALNVLHETLRKNKTDVPKLNRLGGEAINKTLTQFGTSITDEAELYRTTITGDLIANTLYYSLIGGNKQLIFPKAIVLGLTAGIGALKLPEPLGLNPDPVTRTNQVKVLTVGYYVFGALVTAVMLRTLSKK